MVACVNCAPSLALIVLVFICFHTSLDCGSLESVETLTYEQFKSFIDESSVRLVFFVPQVETPDVNSFLREYALAASDLKVYDIKLGLILCQSVPSKVKYCKDDGSNELFVYGFKNSNEKIALPLETLYDSNSIVSSALHLTLIQSVPIIQQLNERQQLEAHCKGKCTIVFTFQRILGTYEHRIFIQAAYLNLNKFLFALTTSEVATIGLRHLQNEGESNGILEEPAVWVLQCSRVERNSKDDCPQSNYRHRIELKQFLQFLQTIHLPDWVIIPRESNNISVDDHEKFKLHSVYFLFDDSSKHDVEMLAPNIGIWFKGTVGVVGINISEISNLGLEKYGFNIENIKLPTVGFKAYGEEKIIIMNEYDNAYNFILDQLRYSSNAPDEGGITQQISESISQLDELQQDDEVAKYINKYRLETKDAASDVTQITDLTYPEVFKNHKFRVILYYLHWDMISQIALEVFSKLIKTRAEFKNFLFRVDCFEWIDVCNVANITSYPTIRIYSHSTTELYRGPLKVEDLLLTINLYLKPNPILLNNTQQVESFTKNVGAENEIIKLPTVVLIGICNDSKIGNTIGKVGSALHGKISLGLCYDQICNEIVKTFSLTIPFVIAFKSMDPFAGYEIMNDAINYENLYKFAISSSMEVFPKLTAISFVRMQKMKKLLVILFRYVNDKDDIYRAFGEFLSTEKRRFNLNFAWLDVRESLGKNIYSSYIANSKTQFPFSFLAIDQGNECFYIYFEQWNEDIECFVKWLKQVEGGLQQPTGYLPEGDWKPRLPGFDYLKFIDEDQVRDTEEKSNPDPIPDSVNELHHSRLYRYPGSSEKKNKINEKPIKINHVEL